jgi:hypothetical protein
VFAFAIRKRVVNRNQGRYSHEGPEAALGDRFVEARGARARPNKEKRMAKQATAKAESSVGKTRKRAVSKTSSEVVSEAPRALSHTEIAQHAYGIFQARGAHDGAADSDWLRAEHELRARVG